VIELDPDYRWVMVGEPQRKYLWVLARDPLVPQDALESMLGRAREAGFPVDRIKLSAQKPPGATTPDTPPSGTSAQDAATPASPSR
jgi:apolipoprotein D and lipocalin family protein